MKTTDLAEARAKRDILERADDKLWSSMILGEGVDAATERYEAARRRVSALGFSYKHSSEITNESLDTILHRIEIALLLQVELIYSNVRFDGLSDQFNGNVSRNRDDSLQGHLGITAEYQTS